MAVLLASCGGALPSQQSLLTELPAAEGSALLAPYELWVATLAPDEGSYGAGPRILILTNDRETAVVYVRGKRTELRHVGELVWLCDPGGSMKETYQAGSIRLQTDFTTSPGEEACWVQGKITVRLGTATEVLNVKGVSGL